MSMDIHDAAWVLGQERHGGKLKTAVLHMEACYSEAIERIEKSNWTSIPAARTLILTATRLVPPGAPSASEERILSQSIGDPSS
jgi:hypothetical protein